MLKPIEISSPETLVNIKGFFFFYFSLSLHWFSMYEYKLCLSLEEQKYVQMLPHQVRCKETAIPAVSPLEKERMVQELLKFVGNNWTIPVHTD